MFIRLSTGTEGASGSQNPRRGTRSWIHCRRGLEVSLFRRLSDAHPDSFVDLREQYRMNEDIIALWNKLIYSDRLTCGSAEVANRKLTLPNTPSKGDLTWLDASHRRQRALEKKRHFTQNIFIGLTMRLVSEEEAWGGLCPTRYDWLSSHGYKAMTVTKANSVWEQ
ncbi:hypothetical protein DFP72DRAFT_45241 [Ephemerocybe angulata]|uniref:DNA2/NAM7 helicase-like C-terminal domain-containing protein n=1 Tax=Ephemerocybe angulata TaxID=980116 RepID=A0A8H6LXG2_9AGAR|nr:hypothetical protein DFP72DRAFT_45241 [Tulosesus angulatus]